MKFLFTSLRDVPTSFTVPSVNLLTRYIPRNVKPVKAAFVLGFLVCFFTSFAQNPLSPAQSFDLFVENDLKITSGDVEGAIAIGGNLVVLGNSQRTSSNATNGVAHVALNGQNYTLVVNGSLVGSNGGKLFKVDPKGSANNNHYVRIGAISPATSAAASGGIDVGNPPSDPTKRYVRVNNTAQSASSIQNSTHLVDIASAFTSLKSNSTQLFDCPGNVTPTLSGNQANVNLTNNGQNVWNVSGTTLNSYGQINITGNLPANGKPLVINVSASGTFNWTNVKLNINGEGDNAMEINRAPYIIWNFPNVTNLTIAQSPLILGSILAPNAVLTNNGDGNITGQVIVKEFIKPYAGELHIAKFNTNVSCSPPSINDCEACIGNLVTNSGFNSNVNNWSSYNGNFFRSTAYPQCGTSGHAEIVHSSSWAGFYQDVTGIPVGNVLTLTFWAGVHNSSANSLFGLEFYNGSTYLSEATVQVDKILGGNPSMQFYTVTATVPSNTTKVRVIGKINGNYLKVDLSLNKLHQP